MKPTIHRFTHFLLASLAAFALAAPLAASTVTIVTDTTPGYYNSSIGNLLNGTSSAFPTTTDPTLDFPSPPNLTPAQSVLGDWLQNPPTLNPLYWSVSPVAVPLQWALVAETAIVYRVEVPASGYTGVTMRFGVDNGIFVWLDGVYQGGFTRPGGAIPGEHTFNVGNLSAGTHYIQILREDHGVTNGYTVEITGDGLVPEIGLAGNGTNILDGDTTPSLADHTDFGLAVAGSGTVVRTFTIQNIGDVALNLTGTPKVAVSGPAAADFAVTLQPTSPIANGGGSTTFQVTFSPSVPGTRSAMLSIANDDGNENPYNFAIQGTGDCPEITVTNPGVSTGQAGVAFSQTFTQSGGLGTTTFSLNSGTLPTGLTLATNGVLSGTPLQVGSFPIAVRATDIHGCQGVGSTYTLVLADPIITVINPDTSSGIVGEVFGQTFTQSGGIGTLTFSIASGSLPAGLTLSPEGELYGTPTGAGSFSVTVRVNDGNGSTGLGGIYSLAIAGQPRIAVDQPLFTPLVGATSVVAWGSNALGQSDVPAGLTQVRAVSAGGSHTLALKEDGTVVAWGNNSSGQASPPVDLSDIQAISAGATHNLALDSSGYITAWGSNTIGESNVPAAGPSPWLAISAGARYSLGTKYFPSLQSNTLIAWGSGQATPPSVAQFGVRSISAGANHGVVLKRGGTVVAWGSNANGETNVPVGLTGVQAVAAGFYHTLALKSDGTVVAWGGNSDGQTNVPAGLTGVRAISAGSFHSLALKNDGTVIAWGGNSVGQTDVPAGLSRVEVLSAGYAHSVALVRGIPTVAFGSQNVGVTSAPKVFTVNNTGTADLILGAITTDGANAGDFTVTNLASTTVAPGGNTYFYLFFNPAGGGPSSATLHIASNDSSTSSFDVQLTGTGLSSDASLSDLTLSEGTLDPIFASATTSYGAAVPTATDSIMVTPTAADSGAVIAVNGIAVDSGSASDGIPLNPGLNTITVVVTAQDGITTTTYTVGVIRGGLPHFTTERPVGLPLPTSRTITTWGEDYSLDTVLPPGLYDVKAIAGGGQHALALRDDGTVIAWGYNTSGQTNVPDGLSGVQAIAAGSAHSVALKDDTTVIAWGDNAGGQTDVPSGLTGVQAIAAGWYHTVALKDDATVVAWGFNGNGQTDVPAGLTGVQAIAAGSYHTLALKSDGTVVAWGYNGQGQTDVPVGLTGVQAIAAGFAHSLALKSDGTVVAWGGDSVPAGLTDVQAIAAGSYHSLALKGDGSVVAWGDDISGQATVPAGLTHVSAIAAGGQHSLALVAGPPFVSFPIQPACAPGIPVTFTIRNTGTADLTLGAFSKSGSDPLSFAVSAPGSTTVEPGGTTTFTISFTPTDVGDHTATLQIATNEPGASPYDIMLTGIGDYSIIQSWRQLYFGTYDDSGDAANTADFDFDGVSNLLEFAFGTDPTTPSGGDVIVSGGAILQRGSPALWLENTPTGVDFRVLYVRRKDDIACGLAYTVQFSADLGVWEDAAAIPEAEVVASDGEMDAVTVTYPFFLNSGEKAQFFRLVVTGL